MLTAFRTTGRREWARGTRFRPLLCSLAAASAPIAFPHTAGAQATAAQNAEATVSGIVRVRNSATVLSGATITVEGTDRTTRSDSLGRYTLRNVPPGPQVLHVRRLGYAPSRTPVTVPALSLIHT